MPRAREEARGYHVPLSRHGDELSESAQEKRDESASRYPGGGGRQSYDEQRGKPSGPMRTPFEV